MQQNSAYQVPWTTLGYSKMETGRILKVLIPLWRGKKQHKSNSELESQEKNVNQEEFWKLLAPYFEYTFHHQTARMQA